MRSSNPMPQQGLYMKTLAILLAALYFSAHASEPVRTQLNLELIIPNRTVMYIANSEEEAALPAKDTGVTFDLSCATLGQLPAHCERLYGGALLDTQGRPYPPVEPADNGRYVASDFPQFFESPERRLRIYAPAGDWDLQAEILNLPHLNASNFAVSINTDGWRCLGFHTDWMENAHCPTFTNAAEVPVSITEFANHSGGWREIVLRLLLRLDGSERSGSYAGVVRYTLASF